ncbi:ferrous-iron efflux pump FieF [Thalassospira sp. MBR-102]|jgi:ferrous-iron efflux pump FieF|uniref:Cation transporter n=5 Tax=Alphaproteobacteria TaxID=28211 RepID=A0A285RT69_9PROT|nr:MULTISPECIES: cation diffusion facilitator family transporter [Thalassospira]MBR9780027.1 cation diffusion facilitator family transporter [Rhodospirillales bacterium]AJD50417.1 cation efflux protein [Thalassospira xiamenensis M-5 = DSM 17429]KEO55727.1 cation transporter [Thalassospira permensis NBRC 106175]KZD03633.1 cation transporter [Thalassospira xiamenensis]KZD08665.1 cation transporter [Thalassospira xiamenensis]|tara:strand:- start:2374 stop:3384 length:1011 start_codon:yes stop_codon:yes gene_type:complete
MSQCPVIDIAQREIWARRATTASIVIAATLIAIKAAGWFMTDSVSLLSSMIDSMLDVGTSVINFMAVRSAWRPADHDHRFGHGKAEPLAGLFQSAFMIGAAILVLAEAGSRLAEPQPIRFAVEGVWIMSISLVMTVGLVLLQRKAVRMSGSLAVDADSMHYTSDILSNLAVIVALVAGFSGLNWADPAIGGMVALFLLYSAVKVGRNSVSVLMDQELPESDSQRIIELTMKNASVIGIHRLRTRSSGVHRFAEIELIMDGGMLMRESHTICHQVMDSIRAEYPDLDITIHPEPPEDIHLDEFSGYTEDPEFWHTGRARKAGQDSIPASNGELATGR